MGFTESLYERERFEEILRIAGDMRIAADVNDSGDAGQGADAAQKSGLLVEEWMRSVGRGVGGYVTPKVAVGAIVGDSAEKILLVQRSDSGAWLYPTGWADVGYSPAEIVIKEVKEETGLDVEPIRLVALFDGLRLGFTRIPLYSLVFQCHLVGGELTRHPLECADVGWFGEDELPSPLAGAERWKSVAFAAIRGEQIDVAFDPPRDPPWRAAPA